METKQTNIGNRILIDVIYSIAYCSVNIFGLLSGYLKINKKNHYATLIRILLQVIFWSFLIGIIAHFFSQGSLFSLILNIFPFLQNRLWYITCYAFVFLCVPFFNLLADTLLEKEYRILLIILTVLLSICPTILLRDLFRIVNNGYSAVWLMYLYILGGYFKKYGFGKIMSCRKAVVMLFCNVFFIVISKYVLEYFQDRFIGLRLNKDQIMIMYQYCSPLTILNAVSIMYICLSYKTKRKMPTIKQGVKKACTWISQVSLGVYIIHAHPYCLDNLLVYENLSWCLRNNPFSTIVCLLVLICFIITLTGFLDWIRIILFRVLGVDKYSNKCGEHLDAIM